MMMRAMILALALATGAASVVDELEYPAKHPLLKTTLDPRRVQDEKLQDKARRLESCDDDPGKSVVP